PLPDDRARDPAGRAVDPRRPLQQPARHRPLARAHAARAPRRLPRPARWVSQHARRARGGGAARRSEHGGCVLARQPAARPSVACRGEHARVPRLLGRVRLLPAAAGDEPPPAAARLLPDRVRTSGAGERRRGADAGAGGRRPPRARAGAARGRLRRQRALMARAEFERVSKRFGDVVALADFTLAVEDGELVTVLGPSGCGKSTLLRLTAGLEPLSGGTIRVGGRSIERLAPHERDVAMVFQSYA